MNRTKLLGGAAAMAALLLVGLAGPRVLRGPVLPAARVRRVDLERTLVLNGRVLAPRKVSVGALTTAVVARRLAEEGDRVKAGQVLADLEASEQRASLAQARAKLAQLLESAAPTARAALAQADSALRQARLAWERGQRLAADGILSDSQLDDLRKAHETALAAREAALAQARSAEGGPDLRAAQAAVDLAEVKLRQMRVLAPAAGVVLTRALEQGDLVQPGKVLYTLALDEPLQLLVQPDEKNLGLLALGQRALASTDARPLDRFEAEVVYLAPGVDATRGTVDLKLRVPAPPPHLLPDMTVSVEIRLGRRPGALVVPLAAVRDIAGAPHVLAHRGGRAVRVPVGIGFRGDGTVEITQGLAEGETVLTAPQARDGRRCRASVEP
ncbi:efflux RND transporter periplasmic adaptor subunit [Mesoterricola sediminis]|uniref:Permease n=1 Tax=Mesoterricola sediminis TaxID=2927980 RepID=A0AA48H4Y1_9BACT|nr:efflux RND transporter periplasmic adaptor subunit [Mesoterricola sediminis]BDU76033.1 permease [Mesoterricola sediminis]